jgi:hypothetical protein
LQVTLSWIVLIERTIDADENFLGQVFGRVGARGKSIGEIVDAPAIGLDNLFPSRTIAPAASSD